jgi:hypothetical protein
MIAAGAIDHPRNPRAGDRGRTGDVQLGKLRDEEPEDYAPWV